MKYVIKKTRQGGSYHNMYFGEDFKTIEKSKLKSYLKNGWIIVRPIYPIITPILKYWKKLNDQNKIAIIGIIFLPILFFAYSQYSNNNKETSDSLKSDSDSELLDSVVHEIHSADLSNRDNSGYKSKVQILKSNDSLIN